MFWIENACFIPLHFSSPRLCVTFFNSTPIQIGATPCYTQRIKLTCIADDNSKDSISTASADFTAKNSFVAYDRVLFSVEWRLGTLIIFILVQWCMALGCPVPTWLLVKTQSRPHLSTIITRVRCGRGSIWDPPGCNHIEHFFHTCLPSVPISTQHCSNNILIHDCTWQCTSEGTLLRCTSL